MAIQSLTTTVIRPEDLLVLRFELVDVDLTPPSAGKAGRITGAASSFLIVHLQAQHIAEQAFFQAAGPIEQSQEEKDARKPASLPGTDDLLAAPGEVQSRLAGPSRLVFVIPPNTAIDYTVAGLLEAMTRLPLSVAAVSAFDSAPTRPPEVALPRPIDTAIELPYRLVLSPDPQGSWQHALRPVTHGLRSELWHTRLGSRRIDGDPRLRAIWSPDFLAANLQVHRDDDPFRASLDARDRNELVHLTSDYNLADFTPAPVATERLMLTTLGGWLRVLGEWASPLPQLTNSGPLTIQLWRHDAVMGRDQYVRVVYSGYLFPFGHRASLVKVTERKFLLRDHAAPPGMVAYLFQRMFIVVREPVRSYTHRDLPFRSITLQTLVTPGLAPPAASQVDPPGVGQEAFWPQVASAAGAVDFLFHLVATDWEARTVELTAPLIFVSATVDGDPALLGGVTDVYNQAIPIGQAIPIERVQRPLAGQAIAFAPNQQPGDTTLEAASLTFGAIGQPDPTLTPHFLPAMSRAVVDVPAVKHLLGKSMSAEIEWEGSYLQASGLDIGNPGEVFLRLASQSLGFTADQVGGLVAPSINIKGLSRTLGPVAGSAAAAAGAAGAATDALDDLISGSFDPRKIFGGLDPTTKILDPGTIKLLGGITLSDIINVLQVGDPVAFLQRLPQLVSERVDNQIRTHYRWQLGPAELRNSGLFVPAAGASFTLDASIAPPGGPQPAGLNVSGALTNFGIVLMPDTPLIQIDFGTLTFTAASGKKPDVAVQLGQIKFLGDLAFVNNLAAVIPLAGFQDPPSLELVAQPPGLRVGFSLGLPTVGLGMMTMQHLSLAAGFFLPFGDQPASFRFAFCERHQPFTLTVSLFGGGGFFAIELNIHEVALIEAALEFGASVALNLGPASGEATVMGGFYFQKTGVAFQLTGYFRAAGDLSVLGIITVSCEFYLGLSYTSNKQLPHGGTLWGQASLTVKIEILFFSESVSVACEREFAGSDPTFRDLVAPADWVAYCQAFAPYPPVPGE